MITVVGPSGETTDLTPSDLFTRLNESGYFWKINGYLQNEIVVFINGNSVELEVIY